MSSNPCKNRGAALRPLRGLIVSMSFRLAIPWRVALQCWAAEAVKADKELARQWSAEAVRK